MESCLLCSVNTVIKESVDKVAVQEKSHNKKTGSNIILV